MRDETWKKALDCAAEQYESYVRNGNVGTPERRRVALDDALQHAFGIIELDRMRGDTRDPSR